ncbi:hypothetical protein LTR81_001121 [Elasticomyces elasticus]
MLETKKKKKEEYEAKKKAAAAAAAAAPVPSPSVVDGAAGSLPSSSATSSAPAAPAPSRKSSSLWDVTPANIDEPPAKRYRLSIADLLASPTTASQQQTRLPLPASARHPSKVEAGDKDVGYVNDGLKCGA